MILGFGRNEDSTGQTAQAGMWEQRNNQSCFGRQADRRCKSDPWQAINLSPRRSWEEAHDEEEEEEKVIYKLAQHVTLCTPRNSKPQLQRDMKDRTYKFSSSSWSSATYLVSMAFFFSNLL